MIIVEIAGFLGADPEERFTAKGKRVVSLRVATRVREGGQDETVWWHVNIWGDRFDKMLPHLKKGYPIIVIGKMSKPKHYTRDGKVEVSLTINADMIEFSPFGRPDRPAESQGQSGGEEPSVARTPSYSNSEYGSADYVGASATQESAFAGDDLPF